MKKPVLVIMAAGMGSRYGGQKQIDPVDEQGQILMDFSIYDAKRAGFEKVVFIIKEENAKDFREAIGNRIGEQMETAYVYQKLNNLPRGFSVPQGRIKPFGTGHAVLSCLPEVDGSFVVINADDYYGPHAFALLYQFLTTHVDEQKYQYGMVGYVLENTLTEHGHVSRGICVTNDRGYLQNITERTHIEKRKNGAAYTQDDGQTWRQIPSGSIVSMNMWGFTNSILKELQDRFPLFLEENLAKDPLKCEFFLPSVVGELIREEKAAVQVLNTEDRWYGMTYPEDKKMVMEAILLMKQNGRYPAKLWEDGRL